MFRAIDRLARYKSGHDGYLRSPDGAVPIGGPAKAGSSGPSQPRKQGAQPMPNRDNGPDRHPGAMKEWSG